ITAICNAIKQIKDEHGETRLSAMPIQDYANSAMYIKLAKAMAWMTSMIAVIVGTVGMLNTMIMSVVERLREISILRAIGWRKSRVVKMVLGESLIISFTGAVIGIVAAIALTRILATRPDIGSFMQPDIAYKIMLQGIMM